MNRTEDVLHRLGSAFVAGLRQPGYQLITAHGHGYQAQAYTREGEPALIGHWPGRDLDEALSALKEIADGVLVIEVVGEPEGRYVIHWTHDPAPARIVLDEDYRFPGHERPPVRQPGAPDQRPTDPEVLAGMRELVAEFVRRHHQDGYAPGYREDEIRAAEHRLGTRLPEDLRALYRIVHDDREESGLPDPAVVQAVDVLEAPGVSFADLSGLPHLRSIVVHAATGPVDMTIPPGLPVEKVHVVAAGFDPALLAGARPPNGSPGLRFLTLAGNTAPVSIAALAALPGLLRLDLSGAAVTDIEAIAGFPALRVLVLNERQWTTLLAAGRLPGTLAAVSLAGDAGVAESTRWQKAFGRAATHHTLEGRRGEQ
ncbi:SMI1/KNR4 family protein [Actinoplanes sp. NPDC023801]|uniref:SMI1/KNR4 family protein n=1 Tax=Actinoplanes sp. NPDC023801 TaxID=3154595 RepID=UPI0033FCD3A0